MSDSNANPSPDDTLAESTANSPQHQPPRSGLVVQLRKLAAALLLAGIVAGVWLMMTYQSFAATPLAIPGAGLHIAIVPGSSLRHVADDLRAQGALKRPWLLLMMARLNGQAHLIKAGEYDLPAGITPHELLDHLVAGKVTQYAFTIVEGWTFRQLRTALTQDGILINTLAELSDDEVMQRLGRAGEHPEGRFLPDTYHFPKTFTDAEFLGRALHAMDALLEKEWSEREDKLPLETPYQALILASIVERETGLAEERPTIAGVFVRRLLSGMLLQTDPTVIYGLGENFDGNLRRADLQTDNPYNTYTRPGLPPTPIALPGAAAIHAVLHPAEGDSLYFVARGDGSHHFSKNLQEHNNAVIKYQLNGRARAFSSNPAPAKADKP